MDWTLLLPLAVAFIGGWLAHRLTARRDLLNERRKLRISYLLEAYRRLEGGGNRNDNAGQSWSQIESASSDIQLLGTPKQVKLARDFAQLIAGQQSASLDKLVFDLRRSLRDELQISSVNDSVVSLRFSGKDATSFDSISVTVANNVADAKIEGASIASPVTRDKLDKSEQISEPVAHIIESWQDLEIMIRNALENKGIFSSNLGVVAVLKLALQNGLITDAQFRSLSGLNVMRNLAVHSPQHEIDNRRTKEFLSLATAMRTVLEISENAKIFVKNID